MVTSAMILQFCSDAPWFAYQRRVSDQKPEAMRPLGRAPPAASIFSSHGTRAHASGRLLPVIDPHKLRAFVKVPQKRSTMTVLQHTHGAMHDGGPVSKGQA
jgi:hypothetical protein